MHDHSRMCSGLTFFEQAQEAFVCFWRESLQILFYLILLNLNFSLDYLYSSCGDEMGEGSRTISGDPLVRRVQTILSSATKLPWFLYTTAWSSRRSVVVARQTREKEKASHTLRSPSSELRRLENRLKTVARTITPVGTACSTHTRIHG